MQVQAAKNSSYLPSICLLDLAQSHVGFRCRGVIGPVPQPL